MRPWHSEALRPGASLDVSRFLSVNTSSQAEPRPRLGQFDATNRRGRHREVRAVAEQVVWLILSVSKIDCVTCFPHFHYWSESGFVFGVARWALGLHCSFVEIGDCFSLCLSHVTVVVDTVRHCHVHRTSDRCPASLRIYIMCAQVSALIIWTKERSRMPFRK